MDSQKHFFEKIVHFDVSMFSKHVKKPIREIPFPAPITIHSHRVVWVRGKVKSFFRFTKLEIRTQEEKEKYGTDEFLQNVFVFLSFVLLSIIISSAKNVN